MEAARADVWSGVATGSVEAPIDKVWKIISDFAGLKDLAPAGCMSSCDVVEGENRVPGCVRLLIGNLSDGTEVRVFEKLLELDNENYLMKYGIEGDNPLAGLCVTLKLSTGEHNFTQVEWSYELSAKDDPALERVVCSKAYGFYHACIENLKTKMEKRNV